MVLSWSFAALKIAKDHKTPPSACNGRMCADGKRRLGAVRENGSFGLVRGSRDSAARSHGQGPALLCGLALANASPFWAVYRAAGGPVAITWLPHACARPSRAAATIAPAALSGSGHAALCGSGHAAGWWPSPWWKSVAEQIAGSLGGQATSFMGSRRQSARQRAKQR